VLQRADAPGPQWSQIATSASFAVTADPKWDYLPVDPTYGISHSDWYATRATDSDRNDICQELDTALSEGQLSEEEHRERVSAATNAKTLGELRSLVSDLQTRQVATQRGNAWSRPAVWLMVVVGVLAVAAAVGTMVSRVTRVPSTPPNSRTTTVTSTAPTAVPTGGTLTVSQSSSKSETIACNDGSLTLSGSGTYVVTGHCVSLTVPVVADDINVTVDKADAITLSGTSITVIDNVCNNGSVMLSDLSKDNVFHGHGHCASLTVSGSRNNVTVENADTITVSGDNNKVTYLSGAPKITDRGINTVFVGKS
jgi:hypothetical protein